VFTESHSTKPVEDTVGWGLETDPETLIATQLARLGPDGGPACDPDGAAELARRLTCPVLVVHGDEDAVRPWTIGARLAELAGGQLVTMSGGGHTPHIRVAYRLDRYRAGRRMDYATTDPDAIAEAIAAEIGRAVDYRPVETGGAARAARLLAELV
jgi:hypothetical protein